MVVYLCTQWAP